jgi:hypothetical protein
MSDRAERVTAAATATAGDEDVLSMKFDGKTVRENLEEAIAAGRLIRLPNGKLTAPEISRAMKFNNGAWFGRDCQFLNGFLFRNVYRRRAVPAGCAACYKVKVETQSMRQMMAVKAIAEGFPRRAKSGAEVDRPDNQSLYATYFYLTGLDEARRMYKQVRARIDADPDLGPSVKVIIKRGCSNYERACGPSDRYTFDSRLEGIERYLRERFVTPPAAPEPDKKYRDAAILLETARVAFRIGDQTYKDFTGGQALFRPTVSYDPEDHGETSSHDGSSGGPHG